MVILLLTMGVSSCSGGTPPQIVLEPQHQRVSSSSGGIRTKEVRITPKGGSEIYNPSIEDIITEMEARLLLYERMREKDIDPNKVVSFHFQDKSIYQALKELFPEVYFNFTDGAIGARVHDFSVKDMSLNAVIEYIDLSANVYFRVQDGELLVTTKFK